MPYRFFFSISCAALLSACGGPSNHYQHPGNGTVVANQILQPLENWNPVPGQRRQHGNQARGEVIVVNGRVVHSEQVYTAWTQSGPQPPSSVQDLQRTYPQTELCWYRGRYVPCW